MIGLIPLNLYKLKLGRRSTEGSKRQARSSLLGLALDGRRMEAVLMRRTNGTLRIHAKVSSALELNLLTDAPELVGREMRNQLDRAGIHERQCSVCLPLEWALTAQVALPALPPEDVESFLSMEAERAFPFAPETLAMVTSRCVAPEGTQFATLVAVPREHLTTLQSILKAAQLKPVTFSLGLSALQDPTAPESNGIAAIAIEENAVQLQVCCGGGVAALRTLQGALEGDGGRKTPYADVVARDLRITLGQLPPELRHLLRQIRVFGASDELHRFAEDLRARAKLMGLDVTEVPSYTPDDPSVQLAAAAPATAALALASRLLTGRSPQFEFLPPKVGAWKQLTNRYSSKKLVAGAAVAGVLLFLSLMAFLFQQWQLGHWRNQWNRIRPQVTQLENMQQQIRRYRPWFDESFRSLSICQKLTEAFPEDGSVVAKTVEIRDPGNVMCTGTARDQQSLLKVVDLLRAQKEFSSVQVDQIRGKQFTINLRWAEGGSL